jgi:hypothetical protein
MPILIIAFFMTLAGFAFGIAWNTMIGFLIINFIALFTPMPPMLWWHYFVVGMVLNLFMPKPITIKSKD